MLSLSKELILELKNTPEFKDGNFDENHPVMIICNDFSQAKEFAINQGWPEEGKRHGIWGRAFYEKDSNFKYCDLSKEYIFVIDLRKDSKVDYTLENHILFWL